MIRLGDHLFHPFHILGLRLEQTAEVMFHGGFYRSSSTAEMATEAITKANEPLTNSRQQSHIIVSSRVFLTAAGAIRFMLHLAVILCLDKIGIILIYL